MVFTEKGRFEPELEGMWALAKQLSGWNSIPGIKKRKGKGCKVAASVFHSWPSEAEAECKANNATRKGGLESYHGCSGEVKGKKSVNPCRLL